MIPQTSVPAYAFRQPETLSSDEAIFASNLFWVITHALGHAPAYDVNDPKALTDEKTLILDLNPASKEADPRHIGLYSSFVRAGDPANADILLQNSFFHDWRNMDVLPGQKVCVVHTLPSHATRSNLKEIKASYEKEIPSWQQKGRVTTAVLIGDLRVADVLGHQWRPEPLIKSLRDILASRNGPVLLVTHDKLTHPEDEKAIREALSPWIVPEGTWFNAAKGDPKNLAALALADAVIVSGDSVPLMSDAVASGKPLRLLHNWHSVPKYIGAPTGMRRTLCTLWTKTRNLARRIVQTDSRLPREAELLEPAQIRSMTFEARLVENLRLCGAKGPFDAVDNPPARVSFDSGWPTALRALKETMTKRRLDLAPPAPEKTAPLHPEKTAEETLSPALG